MIEGTNLTIGEMRESIALDNARRYIFYTMLHRTDRILWRLEEMNRDGVRKLDREQRAHIRQEFEQLPTPVLRAFRDSDRVQVVLDSVFEMQERLFKWRNPKWSVGEEGEEDDLERLAG
ncbi:MAG: hypothetical protein LBJ87_14855 [bacterium]|jgi:hypothetical protein|nr:hypothetical protein [bacterium]